MLKKELGDWLQIQHEMMLSIDSPTFRLMMLDFIENYTENLVRKSLPKNIEEWKCMKDNIKEKLLKSLGLLPLPERKELKIEKTGILKKDDYHIEKIVFEAWPKIKVTGHLYVPEKASFPAPAILYACGHWLENGKFEPDIQACCIGLAKLGFVVFVIDPIGQGERGPRWYDHGHLEILLVGLSQAGFSVWEHIRAIDLLSSLDIVDPNKIGMTGASGGGLYTLYTSAIDERIKVSVPVCYITSFLPFLKSMRGANWNGGIDLCNQVPNIISYADTYETVGLLAPRPCMIITASKDPQFTPQAAKDVYDKASMIYDLYKEKNKIALVEVDSVHGYCKEMREAAYGWFMKWLMGKGNGSPISEPIFTVEDPLSSEIRCLPTPLLQGSLITQLVEELDKKNIYKLPKDKNELIEYQNFVRAKLIEILGNFPEKSDLNERVTSIGKFKDFVIERVLFSSEHGIQVPSFLILPNKVDLKSFIIYLDDKGKEQCLKNMLSDFFIKQKIPIFAIDVRGIGDTKYAEEFEIATDSLMIGRSLLGQRVWDIIRAVDYLYKRFSSTHVKIIGNGYMSGLLALLAASLDERLENVFVNYTLYSFRSLIREKQIFPASVFLFNILRYFDLPQIISSIAPRYLTLSNLVDGLGYPVPMEYIKKEYSFLLNVYKLLEAKNNIQISAIPSKILIKNLQKWFREQLGLTTLAAKIYAQNINQKVVTFESLMKNTDFNKKRLRKAFTELLKKEILKPSYSYTEKYTLIPLPEVFKKINISLENDFNEKMFIPFKKIIK
ncbi:MAG: prolyl oligopeptidase family serine peptidase [Nitrososphaerota archaeon]